MVDAEHSRTSQRQPSRYNAATTLRRRQVRPWPWIAAYRELWQREGFRYDGIATYVVIVDDDGELKISNHHWAGIDWFEN